LEDRLVLVAQFVGGVPRGGDLSVVFVGRGGGGLFVVGGKLGRGGCVCFLRVGGGGLDLSPSRPR